jgi:hypothetical protein
VMERKVRRRKHLLDDFKEPTGHRKLKEEALNRTVCRTRFGREYGPVVKTDCAIARRDFLAAIRALSR